MDEKKTQSLIFWIRFACWTIFAAVLPFTFIAWRFQIFQKISGVSLTGWGIIAIIIVAVFVLTILKYIKKGLPYSMGTQCIGGFCKITLPLLVLLFLIYSIQKNSELMIQALICVTSCETIAIPVNPFPKWMHDNHIEQTESLLSEFANKLMGKKEEKK